MKLLTPKVIICDKKTESQRWSLADDVSVIFLYEDSVKNEIDENVLANNKMRIKVNRPDVSPFLLSGSPECRKAVTISHGPVIDFIEWICGRYRLF